MTDISDAPVTALTCPTCIYARAHHSYPPDGPGRSHCSDCHRSWNSLIEGHCAVCHRHFANYAAFDAHFVEDEHVDPATVMRKDGRPRFASRTTRHGQTWKIAFYGTRPDFSDDDTEEPDTLDDAQEFDAALVSE